MGMFVKEVGLFSFSIFLSLSFFQIFYSLRGHTSHPKEKTSDLLGLMLSLILEFLFKVFVLASLPLNED
jgi:hypothetical protein